LERKEERFVGSFDLSLPNPAMKGTFRTGTITVDLPDVKYAEAMEKGFVVTASGVQPETGEIRVVVRDRGANAAGSLRIPVGNSH